MMRLAKIFNVARNSARTSLSVLALGAFASTTFTAEAVNANEAAQSRYLVQYHSPSVVSKASEDLKSAMRSSLLNKNAKTHQTLRVANFDLKIAEVLKNTRMIEVMATAEEMEALSQSNDVAFVEKEFFFPAPQPLSTSEATTPSEGAPGLPSSDELVDEGEITWGLKAVRAVEAWNEVRDDRSILAGRGSRVLVIDTGIDREHADIRTRFEAGRNFLSARPMTMIATGILGMLTPGIGSFTDDDGAEGNSTEDGAEGNINDYDYYDQNGHGTHVAGTILGAHSSTEKTGVAPLSHLLAGRVCGKFGCSSVGIVRAIEYGVEQAVDVINMSLGGSMPSRAGAEAVAAADAANVVVVCASGNDGQGTVSFPAAYPESFAVGAIDARLAKAQFSNWGPELDIVAPGVDVLSSVPTGTGRQSDVSLMGAIDAQVKSTSFVGSAENTTPIIAELVHVGLGKEEDFTGKDLTGKFALISRGEIAFADKVKNALAAGAIGALIYNNAPGLISGSLSQDGSSVGIPVAMIEQTIGETVAQAVEAGQVAKASIGVKVVDHAAFNGTSMASPHVAGVAALVRAVNKNLTAAQVRRILSETAVPMEASAERPNEYGAGLVNAEAAVQRALQAN